MVLTRLFCFRVCSHKRAAARGHRCDTIIFLLHSPFIKFIPTEMVIDNSNFLGLMLVVMVLIELIVSACPYFLTRGATRGLFETSTDCNM
jgi:hypothetical protein